MWPTSSRLTSDSRVGVGTGVDAGDADVGVRKLVGRPVDAGEVACATVVVASDRCERPQATITSINTNETTADCLFNRMGSLIPAHKLPGTQITD